jgi:hypothetical protein
VYELGVLDTVLIPFDTVCIFDTDEEADVEGDLLLERESITVIDFTDDTEPLLTNESVPAAPAAVCELLNDIEPVEVTKFVWLTDTDPDDDIMVLALITTLAVEAELRVLNDVDEKMLVGLFNMLAEEVKLALAVETVV